MNTPHPAAVEPAQEIGWRPIESAPKDGTLLVLGARNGVWLGKYWPVYGSGFRPENPWSSMLLNHDHMAERYTKPTHWMPLPPAPGARRSESVRDGALEEAALVCDGVDNYANPMTANDCADAIRALKGQRP